jgi:hypothetical protein
MITLWRKPICVNFQPNHQKQRHKRMRASLSFLWVSKIRLPHWFHQLLMVGVDKCTKKFTKTSSWVSVPFPEFNRNKTQSWCSLGLKKKPILSSFHPRQAWTVVASFHFSKYKHKNRIWFFPMAVGLGLWHVWGKLCGFIPFNGKYMWYTQ